MKTKFFSFIFLLLAGSAIGQSDTSKCHLTHAFGFNAGTTTGIGLSYQMYHKNKCGLQFTASPFIYSADNQRLNFALTGLYKLRDREVVDFVSYASLNYIYIRQQSYVFYDAIDTYPIVNTNKVNIGAGIGFEFDFKKNFKASLMGGFAGYGTDNKWQVLPSIESSLFYTL
ncbi:MAG: hypothetical protein ACKOXB_07555 [Flavobacteriales bacterium]